jgi:hypothetical protein
MTPALEIGRQGISGFGYHLRFSATCWEKLPDELENAINILTAYRETAIKLGVHLNRPRMHDIDIYWGYLE